MKKILLIVGLFSMLSITNSCKKTDGSINPFSSVSNFAIGSYLLLDSTISNKMNYSAITTSSVGILVHQYPGSEQVDHIDIYATAGSTYDTTKWHKVKTVAYAATGSTTLSATGAELATALGVPPASLAPGSSYTFYNRIFTKSGKKYDVLNTGDNSGSGLISGAYYNSAFSFAANIVCPFVAPMAGTYKVVIDDDWQDWNDGDLVQVTDGPGANQLNLSKVWPNPAYGTIVSPLVVQVDPATGAATVPTVTFANYGYLVTATSGTGFVFSCTGLIKLVINLGPYGNNRLVLQKQ
jgi:hypothetical protein